MTSFVDTFATPVTRKVGDKTYTLPVLNTPDLIPWLNEQQEKLRAEGRSLVPTTGIRPDDRMKHLKLASSVEVTMESLGRLAARTPEGAMRALRLSAARARMPDEDFDKFIAAADHWTNMRDAVRVCGVFGPAEYAYYFPDQADPLNLQLILALESGTEDDVDRVAAYAKDSVRRRIKAEKKADDDAAAEEAGRPNEGAAPAA